jgi:hypothetical protein
MSLKVLISLQTSTSFPIHRFGSLLAALTHRPVCSTAYDTIRLSHPLPGVEQERAIVILLDLVEHDDV